MEHTEKTQQKGLTVGPVTENLYLSLRAIEQARNYYYCAFEQMGGEQAGADALNEKGAYFDNVRDMLEIAISDAARTWANSSPETNEI